MVIRNRLLALGYRAAAFVGLLYGLLTYFQARGPMWKALCYFGPVSGFMYLILLGFEIVFNAIDLRRGMNGVAAGPYMPIGLSLVCYCVEGGVLEIIMGLYEGNASPSTWTLDVLLIALPLLDWLFFDEKGTVHYYAAFLSLIVPLFYWIFIFFRAIIWPNDPLFAGSNYPYPFLNPEESFSLWGCFVALASCLAFSVLMVFFNNLCSGKFKRKRA